MYSMLKYTVMPFYYYMYFSLLVTHNHFDPYIDYELSPVKPSRNNYMYFNFKLQTANGFCDAVCFDKSLHNQVKQKDETQKSVRLSN